MAQHDQVLDNGPGASVRSDMNAALAAAFSSSSGSVEPSVKVAGQLWWDTVNSVLNVRNQANSAWLPIAINISGSFVAKVGDTMTGSLSIKPTTGSAQLILGKASATTGNCSIPSQSAGKNRWQINLADGVDETGSNAGSNFNISRYDDAGSLIEQALSINRASGTATFSQVVTIAPAAASDPAILVLSKKSGTSSMPCRLQGSTNGVARWLLDLGDTTSETGSNAGSDFAIRRYSDAGAGLGVALSIDRSSGQVTAGAGFFVATNFGFQLNGSVRQFVVDTGGYDFRYQPGDGYRWYYSSVNIMRSHANGDLTISGSTANKASGTTWANPSDERIKQNIRDYEHGLFEVKQLQPRVFNFKPETGLDPAIENIGLIAQECGAMSEMVSIGPGEVGQISLPDMRTLDTSALVFALINAVKELAARVEELEAAANP